MTRPETRFWLNTAMTCQSILSLFFCLFVRVTCAASIRKLDDVMIPSPIDQDYVERYAIWTSEVIKKHLDEWKTEYPDFFKLTTSQEKYGLATAGGKDDCPFDSKANGCRNFMFTLQDFETHPEGSESSNHLPEVFWSGCVHGNERVGPTSVMQATALLLEAAACEAFPRRKVGKDSYQSQISYAKTCRNNLKEKGISDAQRKWLARLVSTRRIVVVPTANALGYYRNRREEDHIDPNRDFPYDLKDNTKCMQTIAGRTINEIYREHMFQLALTFHGGMEVVGYEWGAPTWLGHLSPDDTAQNNVAAAYSRYGGGWEHSQPYKYGTMNDEVYYVRGGMEDWAYAGSWDTERVKPCQPSTFGGYPVEKTQYNNSTLRAFNMLVETSDIKEPKNDLGTSLDVLNFGTKGNGHISRNIRLALLAADLVEPYVSIFRVNNLALSDDIVPMTDSHDLRGCQKDNSVTVAKNEKNVIIEFTVGGALAIDDVQLFFAKWDDIETNQIDCFGQPKSLDGFVEGTIIGPTTGNGFFSESGSVPTMPSDDNAPNGPVFQGKITIPDQVNLLDQFVVIASAKVDQHWTEMPDDFKPDTPPQSHIVNARTNPDWHHHSAEKHVKGRLYWFSRPLTVVIGDFEDGIGKQGGHIISTIENNPRMGADHSAKGGALPKNTDNETLWNSMYTMYVLSTLVFCLGFCCCKSLLCPNHEGFKHVEGVDDNDDFIFEAKPYSDDNNDEDSEDSVEDMEEPFTEEVELQSLPKNNEQAIV